jgi:hypothetical protein
MAFRCLSCDKDIPHPDDESACEASPDGGCKHLIDQGAVMVWVNVQIYRGQQRAFSRGGWVCRACKEDWARRTP